MVLPEWELRPNTGPAKMGVLTLKVTAVLPKEVKESTFVLSLHSSHRLTEWGGLDKLPLPPCCPTPLTKLWCISLEVNGRRPSPPPAAHCCTGSCTSPDRMNKAGRGVWIKKGSRERWNETKLRLCPYLHNTSHSATILVPHCLRFPSSHMSPLGLVTWVTLPDQHYGKFEVSLGPIWSNGEHHCQEELTEQNLVKLLVHGYMEKLGTRDQNCRVPTRNCYITALHLCWNCLCRCKEVISLASSL